MSNRKSKKTRVSKRKCMQLMVLCAKRYGIKRKIRRRVTHYVEFNKLDYGVMAFNAFAGTSDTPNWLQKIAGFDVNPYALPTCNW